MAELAGRIKSLREAKGLTQAELAVEARLISGRNIICSWEDGGQPGARFIPALADALGVSSHYLLTGRESEFTTSAPATDTTAGA